MGNLLSLPISEDVLYMLEALDVEEEEYLENLHAKKKKVGNRHRNRGYALNEVGFLSDSQFQSMFRMTRSGFENLLNKVSPFMHDVDEHMATVSSGSPITNATKLYVTLRFLAGASFHDLYFAWGIAKSTLFSNHPEKGVIWPTIRAIDECFTIGLPVHDTDQLDTMAQEFSTYAHGEMLGCVTAIDGWVAAVRKPRADEVTDVMAYRNRHDCWGLVVLAGCDARCRYTMFSCTNSGSTNDCIAWELSEMNNVLNRGELPNRYYIIGDEAFQCTNQLLVPYSGRGLGPWKDSYNYHLSVMRQCIERSFALLIDRWGILWRPLRCQFQHWTLILTVCAKLHNYCLDANIPLYRERYPEDEEVGDVPDVLLNEIQNDEEPRTGGGPANRRTLFTQIFEDKGIRRPNHAYMNSRA